MGKHTTLLAQVFNVKIRLEKKPAIQQLVEAKETRHTAA